MDISPFQIAQDQLTAHATAMIQAGPRLVGALILLFFFWIIARILRFVITRVARRARLRTALVDLLSMLTFATVMLVAVLAAAAVLFPTITPGKLLTALGLGSVAIGFAFKDILENFFAGVLLLLREPFGVGDHIASDDAEGSVEEITIRDTHIRQTDGQLVEFEIDMTIAARIGTFQAGEDDQFVLFVQRGVAVEQRQVVFPGDVAGIPGPVRNRIVVLRRTRAEHRVVGHCIVSDAALAECARVNGLVPIRHLGNDAGDAGFSLADAGKNGVASCFEIGHFVLP